MMAFANNTPAASVSARLGLALVTVLALISLRSLVAGIILVGIIIIVAVLLAGKQE